MSWLCNKCNSNTINSNLNDYCTYCFSKLGIKSPKPASVQSSEIDLIERLAIKIECYHLSAFDYKHRDKQMTPKEELFAKFFNGGVKLVEECDDLEIRARIEELSKIAFEARATLTGINAGLEDKKTKRKFDSTSTAPTESDDQTSQLINQVKERQKRISKQDKLIAQFTKPVSEGGLGLSVEDATRMFSATAQLEIVKANAIDKAADLEAIKPKPALKSDKPFIFVNPFAKKD